MPPNADRTRTLLVAAAEGAFAARGVFGASLREINLLAGQRNNAAVHLHFGGREGLLEAVLKFHMSALHASRARRLDEVVSTGPLSVRDVVDLIAAPLLELLHDPRGRRYVRIVAELLRDPAIGLPGFHAHADPAGSARVRGLLVERLGHLDPDTRTLRIELMTTSLFHLLADQARRIDADAIESHRDTATFGECLIDALAGLVSATPSERPRGPGN